MLVLSARSPRTARLVSILRAVLGRNSTTSSGERQPEPATEQGPKPSNPGHRLEDLEAALGLRFRDRSLLQLAFIHSSYVNENPGKISESNERLEFLGDAVVGLAVAQELYSRHPDRSEGELTPLRSALVRGETLARVAGALRLGTHLVMGKGEEASGGRRRVSNLAATFEALVGALFLDQGYDAAREFVLRALDREMAAVGRRSVPMNPKSALQELVQRKGLAAPSYRIVGVAGQDHDRVFTAEVLVSGEVMGRGTGRRKAVAEQEAAKAALKTLDPQP